MVWLYLLVCLVAGALMPLQAGVNAQLARWVGHPVTASLVSFAVGTLGFTAGAEMSGLSRSPAVASACRSLLRQAGARCRVRTRAAPAGPSSGD